MLLVAAAALAQEVPEGATVALNPPPALPLPGPVGGGVRVVGWSEDSDDPDVVRRIGRADDGSVLLSTGSFPQRRIWELRADGTALAPWASAPHRFWEATESGGLWFVPTTVGMELRRPGGELVAQVPWTCVGAGIAGRVDGGVLAWCDERLVVVRSDGTRGEPPASLTLPGGRLDASVGPRPTLTCVSHGAEVWRRDDFGSYRPSPDGRWLLTGTGRQLVELATGRVTELIFETDGWTADGDLTRGRFRYDRATGLARTRPEGHGGRVSTVAWSPDGTTLASGGDDGAVLLWDPAGGPPVARLDGPSPVRSLAWSDGAVVVTRADRSCARWVPGDAGAVPCEPAPPGPTRAPPGFFLSSRGTVVTWGWPDETIWIVPEGRVDGRPPRDVVVLAPPGKFPDPDAMVGGLRAGRVAGDRVAYAAPGGAVAGWVDVEDPRAVELLRAEASEAAAGDLAAVACHPEGRYDPPAPGHTLVVAVVGAAGAGGAGCLRTREVVGDAFQVLRVVRWRGF